MEKLMTALFAGWIFCAVQVLGARPAPDPDEGGITLPPGFRALVFTDNLVAGDTAQPINVLLQGPAKVLPADRPKFQNVMPPFGPIYKDADIASLINYLRANFAPNAPEVAPEDVAAQRAKL